MATFDAIYENGILRPSERLPFKEGEAVKLTVKSAAPRQLSPEEWTQMVQAASSIEEWATLANSCPDPDPDDDYDVVEAMNETRRANGERLLTREK